jgi:histone-lysine N-methyltransferase SETD2
MNKYTHKLPKDDLKRLAKDISKKLVASDYKNNRVGDPTVIPTDLARGAKKHVKQYLDKAVVKYREHEKKKAADRAAKASKEGGVKSTPADETPSQDIEKVEDEVVLTDAEDSPTSSVSNTKRKRGDEEAESAAQTPSETPSAKRVKEDDVELPCPPPPPPPPPDAAATAADTPLTEEERSIKEQEEALMRENEEAQRLADAAERTKHLEEEAALERENEEAMRAFELTHNPLPGAPGPASEGKTVNRNGGGMDVDGSTEQHSDAQARKMEVLSH